jgi:ubiquinol-cytochrome c reductase iron-sulfur subunit
MSVDETKRRALTIATSTLGLIGVGFAATPLVLSMKPSARARAAGGPIQVDLSKLEPGQQLTLEWHSKPVWVLYRTDPILKSLGDPSMLAYLKDPDSKETQQQPLYARNQYRSINPNYFVSIGLCTHLGCVPLFRPEIGLDSRGNPWPGGYFCPCHGSMFDFAGRVYKSVPAPTNLIIPPHHYPEDKLLVIGTDKTTDQNA